MPSFALPLPRDEKTVLTLLGIVLFIYFAIMDIILYRTLQGTTLTESASKEKTIFSPFRSFSVKMLMNDHASSYIILPTAEYFDLVTHFSTIFYFITPNMITFVHLIVAAVSAKFMSSENLHDRRIGVFLFELRTWLDALDGVVFRSHSGKKKYHSLHATMGYYLDSASDAIGGTFICFGILFYLFKYFDKKQLETLPWTKNGENGTTVQFSIPTKKTILWKLVLFGFFMVAISSAAWDNVIEQLKDILETPLDDPDMTVLQSKSLHSGSMFLLISLWRIVEGQALLQYFLIAVFIDKVWEFVCLVQYVGQIIVVTLYVVSIIYIHHLRSMLHMK